MYPAGDWWSQGAEAKRDKASRGDVDETRTRPREGVAAAERLVEEEEGEDATPARQESRRSRSPTIGQRHRQPPERSGNRASLEFLLLKHRRRESLMQDDLRTPLRVPLSPPEIDIYT